ncbi:MAG TPA: hypothetical protein V6D35_21370, partial [Candidatus Sericytochromatia bacterium]
MHKSEKGEAFADKNPDFNDKSGRKCFAPTAKNRLLQEVYYWRVDHSLSPVLLLGFLIIKTKRHCEQLAELTPGEAAALGPIIHNTCLVLSQILQ